VYEEKYDGYRILAYKEGRDVTLLSRNAKDRTETFSEIARAIAPLPDRTLLLDGEAVAFDRKLVSRFQLLQQGDRPTVYAVFDCLYRNGRDLRNEPLPDPLRGASPGRLPRRRAPLRRKGRHRLSAEDARVALSAIPDAQAEGPAVRLPPARKRGDLARTQARRADLLPRVDGRPEA